MAKWILLLILPFFLLGAHAAEAVPASNDPVLEAQMMHIASELRCLVCQNQTIADSHAALAVDLRQQVRELIAQGKTQTEIFDFMTARYGDFVLYRPPLKGTTLLLWVGPALMAVLGMLVLFLILRRRSRMGQDQFEADDIDAGNDTHYS
jgi:cytochrome c-type biogenesis protein CcmH